MNTLIS